MSRKFEYEKDPLKVNDTIQFYRDDLKECEMRQYEFENDEKYITDKPRSQGTARIDIDLAKNNIDFYQIEKEKNDMEECEADVPVPSSKRTKAHQKLSRVTFDGDCYSPTMNLDIKSSSTQIVSPKSSSTITTKARLKSGSTTKIK